MDNQPIMPGNSGPFSSNPTGGGGRPAPILLILVVLLGLGTVVFAILTLTFSGKASTATKTLAAQKSAAAAAARDDQKKQDTEASTKASESPYRPYTAPQSFGSFVINFPKTWTSTIDEESHGTQVKLILSPDFVRRTNGVDAPVAAKVVLLEQTRDSFLAQFANPVKRGTMKQSTFQVSGQPAFDLTGEFPDRKTIREVVVPIRDKVLLFSTENAQYASEFNEILSQAKIIP